MHTLAIAEILTFGSEVTKISQKKLGVSAPTPHFTIHNQTQQHVDTCIYLGLLISHNLSWSEHIICTMCNKAKS